MLFKNVKREEMRNKLIASLVAGTGVVFPLY